MDQHQTGLLIVAMVGLLAGLLIAEYYYKKAARHTNHVMPATIIKNSHHVMQQKLFYYGFFLTILFAEYVLHINVPEPVYWLDGFAIAGGDVQKLAVKFFRLK